MPKKRKLPPKPFNPPFCPNSECKLHHPKDIPKGHSKKRDKRNWFIRKGSRFLARGQEVFLFRCKQCNTGFSSRTFSIDYYAKRQLNYQRLLDMAVSCMSIRAMARALHCSVSTIQNKLDRLSRQAAAFKSIITPRIQLKEDLAADGFESFVSSQYHPNNFTILVGSVSQYVYFFNYAQLRRKGRMTDSQKLKAEHLKRVITAAPYQVEQRFCEVIDKVVYLQQRSLQKKHLVVYTDEKIEYKRALDRVVFGGVDPSRGYRITHHTTSSKQRRDSRNPLFPVNYMDREFRKDLAEHVRETTRFGRNTSNAVGRMELYQFHHNHFKSWRINVRDRVYDTHAEAAGLERVVVEKLQKGWLKVRQFCSHLELDMHLEKVWFKGYTTPGKWRMDHVPAYVYQ